MKRKTLYLLCLLPVISISCNKSNKSDKDFPFPIIDVNYTNYLVETKNLHEIADVEYIPLETTENSLLKSTTAVFSISDKYIITNDLLDGDVWIFTRSGEFLSTFNHSGNGPGEYNRILKLICDFDKQEIFIYDNSLALHVYTFNGEFERTFRFPNHIRFDYCIHNYDSEFLIGYNDQYFTARKDNTEDIHPYYLIGKKDGKLIHLPLFINERISKTVNKEIEIYPGGITETNTNFLIYPLFNNGSEVIVSDFALDTIYSFNNMILTPIACRKPPVWKKRPPKIVVAQFDTDYFTKYRIIDMIYDPSDPYKHYNESLEIIWDKRREKFIKWIVYDFNYSKDKIIFPDYGLYSSLPRNYGEDFYMAYKLVDNYEKGQLSGELKEIASKLKEDDNPVLVIAKYK